MKRVVISVAVLVACLVFFFSPTGWSVSMRHQIGLAFVKAKYEAPAMFVYRTMIGDPLADNNYAVLLVRTCYDEKDPKVRSAISQQANELYINAYQRGFGVAAYNLGMFYFKRTDKGPLYENGKLWLRRAAQHGDDIALLAYAMHLDSSNNSPDLAEKRMLLRKLADKDIVVAQTELAYLLRGNDRTESLRLYRRAAEQGSYAAIQALAFALWNSPSEDREDWLPWMIQAAELGSPSAQRKLSIGYRNGWYGLPVDITKAVYWLEMVATRANVRELGPWEMTVAADGLRSYTPRSVGSAIFERDFLADAYDLAEMYSKGSEVERDLEKARRFYRLAGKYRDAEARLSALGK